MLPKINTHVRGEYICPWTITIIKLYLSKVRGILKFLFFAPTLKSKNTSDVRL